MKKIIFTCFLILSTSQYIFAQSCPLDNTSNSPLNNYIKNVEKILETVNNAAQKSSCVGNLEIQSVPDLLKSLEAVGFDTTSLFSDVRFYFDPSDTVILPKTIPHQNLILEIQQKILKSATQIGSKCAQKTVKISENVTLSNSTYLTKDRYIEEILLDTYAQTKHVFVFFRNLVTNISDREHVDETNFSIAPKWFANDMREFYSSENLQKCLDQDPKNQKIKEAIATASRKSNTYKQAWEMWRESFQQLLYPAWSSVPNTTSDGATNNPEKKAQADFWGVGNSREKINENFFKETFERTGETVAEIAKRYAARIAYQLPGTLFGRQIIDDVKNENQAQDGAVLMEFVTSNRDGTGLATLDKNLYDDYALRKESVLKNKAQDPQTVVGLVRSIEYLELIRPIVEEIAESICDIYDRQATNVQKPTCEDLFNA
jgi:hypothetical protein